MAKAEDYIEDVRRYAADASMETVAKIVKHLGIALSKKDSSLVSGTDQAELDRVRDSWGVKKLGLAAGDAAAAVAKVADQMKGDRQKQRVTFYYLVALHTGKLGTL